MTQPRVHAQFDEATHTVSYVVWDPATCRAAIIDPVLDFDMAAGRTGTASAQALLAHVREHRLDVHHRRVADHTQARQHGEQDGDASAVQQREQRHRYDVDRCGW